VANLGNFIFMPPCETKCRRFTRENASPSFQPLTDAKPCVGSPMCPQLSADWVEAKCELSSIKSSSTSVRKLKFNIKGLPKGETATFMISDVSPTLEVAIPGHPSTETTPAVIFDLKNGDEFSIHTKGSGMFTINLFSQMMHIGFQREYAIVDIDASKQLYSTAIQKKEQDIYPEIIFYTNDTCNDIQSVHLGPNGFIGFNKKQRVFFTYWNAIHSVTKSNHGLNIQLYTGENYRFQCIHARFLARLLKFYRSIYKHTSKAPEPLVDAFKVLHDFGF